MGKHEKGFIALGVATLLALGWAAYAEVGRRTHWSRYRDEALAIAKRHGASPGKSVAGFGEDCGTCHANATGCGLSRPYEVAQALEAGLKDEQAMLRYCIDAEQLKSIRAAREALCTDPGRFSFPSSDDEKRCLTSEEAARATRATEIYCAPGERRVFDPAKCLSKDEHKSLAEALAKATYDVPPWARTHPHRERLLDKHLGIAAVGCQDCHGGDPLALAAVRSGGTIHSSDPKAPSPVLELVEFGRHAGAGNTRRRLPALREATCARCHPEDSDLDFAPALSKGRKLFRGLGCSGCHPLAAFESGRIPGPQLRGIGAKLPPEWLLAWIREPRKLLPRTRMPSVFVPALNADATAEARRERDEDSQAIAAFLLADDGGTPTRIAASSAGDPKAGEALFVETGCAGCHPRKPGAVNRPAPCSTDRDLAPNLAAAGDRLNRDWLVGWLTDPQAWWREARMPQMRLSDVQVRDLADYLMSLRSLPPASRASAKEPATPAGRAAVRKWGCFDCHLIKSFERMHRMGADLDGFATRAPEELDFGDALPDSRDRDWFDWVDLKLRQPYAYVHATAGARMPQFNLSEDEIEALIVFLRSLGPAAVVPEHQRAEQGRWEAIVRGGVVIDELGCRGCHSIDGTGGLIRDEYISADLVGAPFEDADKMKNAPPALIEEGARVQPGWLYAYLRDPKPVRPWLHMKMPVFPCDGTFGTVAALEGFQSRDWAADLTEAFAAKAGKTSAFVALPVAPMSAERRTEAEALYRDLRCFACHDGPVAGPRDPGARVPPDLRQARARLRPEWIRRWLLETKTLQPGTVMPAFFVEYTPGRFLTASKTRFGGKPEAQLDALRDLMLEEPGKRPPTSK